MEHRHRHDTRWGGRRGLTLIEIIVTVTIVAGLMGATVYSIQMVTNSTLRNEAMRLTSAFKYTWSRAALNNAQYRMVLDFQNSTYHTEVTDAPLIAEEASPEEGEGAGSEFLSEEARELSEQQDDESFFESEEEKKTPFNVRRKTTYEQVENSVVKKRSLPEGLEFHRVITSGRPPVESGRAAIHFFPDGFQEPAIVVLKNADGAFYSLKTEPLTGRVHIYSKELKDDDELGAPIETQDEW